MITAIIRKLKTGTISNVYPRGCAVVNPAPPYIIVWGPELIPQPGENSMGINQYFISVHFARGFVNQLDDYIYNEIVPLLDNIRFVMRDGRKATLHKSDAPSNLIESNDDNTISKERVFITAAIY
jgi:hypothetical protein